jgi:uncharacterized protein YdaL
VTAPGQRPLAAPARYNSFLAPGYRPAIPALGGSTVGYSRITPNLANALGIREASIYKNVLPQGAVKSSLDSASKRVLVVYDNAGTYKFLGELYGRQMSDLLSHFGYPVDLVPTDQYRAGMISSHRATVYVGALFDTPLSGWFELEALASLKPVCWVGSNLWKIAWNDDYTTSDFFEWRFGFRFEGMDSGFTKVQYKATDLGKLDTSLARIKVLDSRRARVLATATNEAGETVPYITKSGNFTFVGDNPLSTVAYAGQPGHDRTLAFCDVLHDVLGTDVMKDHKAVLRIEDVNALSDPTALREIADFLSAEGVPFAVSLIPIYRDPLGYWTGGVPVEYDIDMAPEVLAALKYMESKGGQIIQHGTTHQLDDIPNPFHGISGSDWEFFRVVKNDFGSLEFWGPVWGDSEQWVKDRTERGRAVLQRSGFDPKGWLTPHYMASPIDYDYFAKAFDYSLCPSMTFGTDAAGYLFYLALNAPYPIKDHRGAVHLPETLSYISPAEANMMPENVIERARKVKVVRDGWAGFFFHPFLDRELLRTAVRGVKAEGFQFVNPSKEFGPKGR